MTVIKTGIALTCVIAAAVSQAAGISLFNGKDLSGWGAFCDYNATGGYSAQENTWFVSDGAIRTTGTPFGYLKTTRSDYKNFRLRLKYRWWRKTPSPNSGVFVRLGPESATFIPKCYENQLCEGKAGDLLGLCGMPIDGLKPNTPYNASNPLSGITISERKIKTAEKPFGEWNTLEVEVVGKTLVNRLNGVEQSRVAGIVEKAGAIGLQSEGGAIEFKDIYVETLP